MKMSNGASNRPDMHSINHDLNFCQRLANALMVSKTLGGVETKTSLMRIRYVLEWYEQTSLLFH